MAIEFEGSEISTSANGYLENPLDWSEGLAKQIAAKENIELTDKHFDVINFLRDQYINNNQNQPNTRKLVKAMSDKWGEKVSQRDLYDLFPGDPSKQGGLISGLPESRRKGGY